MPVKSIAALIIALSISFAAGCGWGKPVASANNSAQATEPKMLQAQQKNWGEPFSGLRLSMSIEPPVADQTSRRLISLTFHNSAETEIKFKPFISFQLSGASDDNSFWAPGDLTMPKSDFPRRGFPRATGQPEISLAHNDSKTLTFYLEDLGWDTLKSSYYKGESFYSLIPAGKYELVAAIELWEGQIKTGAKTAPIPKGSSVRSQKLKLQVSAQDSRKVVTVEN